MVDICRVAKYYSLVWYILKHIILDLLSLSFLTWLKQFPDPTI